MGSLAELETQLILCERLKFLSPDESGEVLHLADEVGKMMRGLQRSLREKLN
jgi:four helix bundle protein